MKKTGSLVIVRHGRSVYNDQNRFAGWVDTPLTETGDEKVNGRLQAKMAGQKMRKDGFEPDVAYTTRLKRARDTGSEALMALGKPQLPLIESDALLERHYGALTGMNKKEAEDNFGPEQFLKYRRSYDTPPPAMDSSHPFHPANPSSGDKVIAMPPNGKGTECLADVIDRVRPFWEEILLPQLQEGKNIFIAAHGNSLRALSMIIEGMTPEQIQKYEIENGKPIQINIESAPGSKEWKFLSKRELTGMGSGRAAGETAK